MLLSTLGYCHTECINNVAQFEEGVRRRNAGCVNRVQGPRRASSSIGRPGSFASPILRMLEVRE